MTTLRGFSIECLIRWLKVREQEGHPFPQSVDQLEQDIHHSALLTRLLRGYEPLPEAPPKAMSYPWYEIVERGRGEPIEVWEAPADLEEAFGYRALVIDQHPWKIVKKNADDDFVVTYGNSTTRWRARVVGERGVDQDSPGMPKRWVVEKVDG